MLTIYRVTPKNSTPLIEEKIKHIIVKHGEVKIIDNKKYIPDSSCDFTFEVGKSNAQTFKKHIEKNIDNFNENFPAKFIELLTDQFDIHEQLPTPIQVAIVQPNEEEETLLAEISKSAPSTPILTTRPTSVRFENTSSFEELRRKSFHDLPGEDSAEITNSASSITAPSQHSIHSQDSEKQDTLIANTQKINSFFTQAKYNANLVKMERHGNKIENGYFNGSEKSKILLDITRMAAEIKKASNTMESLLSNEQVDVFKQKISELNEKINDEQTIKTLSRYRGFSPLRCFATLWGGGKVTSIDYVNQLRNELKPLIDEAFSVRPIV
ncbi:MAG: hypothetical protein E6K54_07145 [Gammaproteobacteria bacterium]|nr:MAG: hypothetical protein E6K54_07145 [Gammaproteobacteria bacterium]